MKRLGIIGAIMLSITAAVAWSQEDLLSNVSTDWLSPYDAGITMGAPSLSSRVDGILSKSADQITDADLNTIRQYYTTAEQEKDDWRHRYLDEPATDDINRALADASRRLQTGVGGNTQAEREENIIASLAGETATLAIFENGQLGLQSTVSVDGISNWTERAATPIEIQCFGDPLCIQEALRGMAAAETVDEPSRIDCMGATITDRFLIRAISSAIGSRVHSKLEQERREREISTRFGGGDDPDDANPNPEAEFDFSDFTVQYFSPDEPDTLPEFASFQSDQTEIKLTFPGAVDVSFGGVDAFGGEVLPTSEIDNSTTRSAADKYIGPVRGLSIFFTPHR